MERPILVQQSIAGAVFKLIDQKCAHLRDLFLQGRFRNQIIQLVPVIFEVKEVLVPGNRIPDIFILFINNEISADLNAERLHIAVIFAVDIFSFPVLRAAVTAQQRL